MIKKPAVKKIAKKRVNPTIKENIKKELTSVKHETLKEIKAVKNYNYKNIMADLMDIPNKIKLAILQPKKLFEGIKNDNNIENDVIKSAIYGFFGALICIIAGLISFDLNVSSFFKLIYMPIFAVMFLFSFAGILNLFSYLCKGKLDFEYGIKVVSSKMYLFPLIILINILSFNYVLLLITSFIIDLFILYLIYNVIIHGFKGNLKEVKYVFIAATILLIGAYFTQNIDVWLALKNQEVIRSELHKVMFY